MLLTLNRGVNLPSFRDVDAHQVSEGDVAGFFGGSSMLLASGIGTYGWGPLNLPWLQVVGCSRFSLLGTWCIPCSGENMAS